MSSLGWFGIRSCALAVYSFMNYVDIHTHHSSATNAIAVLNVYPEDFNPQNGYYYSVGIHPWNAHLASVEKLNRLAECVAHKQVVAIGEVGIDKHAQASLSVQVELFKQQALLAEYVHKPLVIHVVKAMDELLAMKQLIKPIQPWIIHGFRGKSTVAQVYLNHGFYISFGEKFQSETLQQIPTNRLLLETDESECTIQTIYQQVALCKKMPMEHLLQAIGTNVNLIFPSLI